MNALTRIVNELKALKEETNRLEAAERAEVERINESYRRVADIDKEAKRVIAEQQLIAELEAHDWSTVGGGVGIAESMKFGVGKNQPMVKALYPKTNAKRIADEWNQKVGDWFNAQRDAGHQMLVRHGDEPLVVDAIDDEGQFETMVVRGRNGNKHSEFTIDFLNQRHGSENEHSGDFDHEGPFKFKTVKLQDSASSDQRNKPTTMSDSRAQRGRKKDGQSLRGLAATPKSGKPLSKRQQEVKDRKEAEAKARAEAEAKAAANAKKK